LKQETITLYRFTELAESAQKKLIERRVKQNVEFLDTREMEYMMRSAIDCPDHAGPDNPIILAPWIFEMKDMFFSLGNSQGDGVCFTGCFDAKRLINMWLGGRIVSEDDARLLDTIRDDVRFRVVRTSSHYCHKHTIGMDADAMYLGASFFEIEGDEARADKLVDQIADYGMAIVRRMCDRAEKVGYDMIADAYDEDRAREELTDDAEEKYLEDGREY
jgi:hypothetical protein